MRFGWRCNLNGDGQKDSGATLQAVGTGFGSCKVHDVDVLENR